MADQETIKLGNAAATLLASSDFTLVVEKLRSDILISWTQTPSDHPEVREQLYYLQLALAQIVGKAQALISNGKVETQKLIQEEASAKENNDRGS